MNVMPIFLKLDQKPILVIGNGQMAEAKINLLTQMGQRLNG